LEAKREGNLQASLDLQGTRDKGYRLDDDFVPPHGGTSKNEDQGNSLGLEVLATHTTRSPGPAVHGELPSGQAPNGQRALWRLLYAGVQEKNFGATILTLA